VDLIYVLDSPGETVALREYARQLFELYGLPFRVAALNRSGGVARALNAGASLAVGRLLLLLQPSVLPQAPGWLEALTACHERTPQVGAVGPKLLYEDGSIQHAGQYFDRPPSSPLWEVQSFFRGLHGELGPGGEERSVPALSGACLLLSTQLFRNLGGLADVYVHGGFADTDLCLRLQAAGRTCRYTPDAVLYHLELESYTSPAPEVAAVYNRWLHSLLWNGQIETLTATAGSSAP
jgi:GT2 family glycosyltransferase